MSNPDDRARFDPPLPQSILAHKPLYMLIQVPDQTHLRVGFKAARDDRVDVFQAVRLDQGVRQNRQVRLPRAGLVPGGLERKKRLGCGQLPEPIKSF